MEILSFEILQGRAIAAFVYYTPPLIGELQYTASFRWYFPGRHD